MMPDWNDEDGDFYLIQTHRIGDGNRWWTYFISKNKEDIPLTPFIYRMYSKRETAMRNGFKVAAKHANKKPKKQN